MAQKKEPVVKDLNYWRTNAEEDYITTPISVLRYISELELIKDDTKKPTLLVLMDCHNKGLTISDAIVTINNW